MQDREIVSNKSEEKENKAQPVITAYKYRADGSKEVIEFTKIEDKKAIRKDNGHLYFFNNQNRNESTLHTKYPHLAFALSAIVGRIYRILLGKIQPTYFAGKDEVGEDIRLAKEVLEFKEVDGPLLVQSQNIQRLMLAILAALFLNDDDMPNNIGLINYKGRMSIVKIDPEMGLHDLDIDWKSQKVKEIFEHLLYLYDPTKGFIEYDEDDYELDESSDTNEIDAMKVYGAHMPSFLKMLFSYGLMQEKEVVDALLSGKLRNELFVGLAVLLNSQKAIDEAIDKMVPDSEMTFKTELKKLMAERIEKFQKAAFQLPNFTQYYEEKQYLDDPLYKLYFAETKTKTTTLAGGPSKRMKN